MDPIRPSYSEQKIGEGWQVVSLSVSSQEEVPGKNGYGWRTRLKRLQGKGARSIQISGVNQEGLPDGNGEECVQQKEQESHPLAVCQERQPRKRKSNGESRLDWNENEDFTTHYLTVGQERLPRKRRSDGDIRSHLKNLSERFDSESVGR